MHMYSPSCTVSVPWPLSLYVLTRTTPIRRHCHLDLFVRCREGQLDQGPHFHKSCLFGQDCAFLPKSESRWCKWSTQKPSLLISCAFQCSSSWLCIDDGASLILYRTYFPLHPWRLHRLMFPVVSVWFSFSSASSAHTSLLGNCK